MKKEFILIFIFIFLISLVSILYLDKNNHSHINLSNNNPYQEFSFYKKENLTRYSSYYLKTRLNYKDIVLRVNMNLDYGFYSNTKETSEFNQLMIINKYNYVSEDFIPEDLVEVLEYSKPGMKLTKNCMIKFIEMAKEASNLGYNLRAISTYRTYDYQKKLYNNYIKKDGIEMAETYSARPGFSEHHTGLAIDIDNGVSSFDNFENTKEFLWLKENAYKYGFILRYPKEKENITGYIYEPWHYRYVGFEIAKYIYLNNLTYEEYYYEFLDK